MQAPLVSPNPRIRGQFPPNVAGIFPRKWEDSGPKVPMVPAPEFRWSGLTAFSSMDPTNEGQNVPIARSANLRPSVYYFTRITA
ncbi:hypothetical protein GCM10028813_33220 [Ramlibacter alkalitolerans]